MLCSPSRADAVTPGPDARLYFTEPFTEQMTMKDLLLSIGGESIGDANDRPGNIHYLQSQNGNLYSSPFFQGDPQDSSEFEALRKDVPSEVRWCSEALSMLSVLYTLSQHRHFLFQTELPML